MQKILKLNFFSNVHEIDFVYNFGITYFLIFYIYYFIWNFRIIRISYVIPNVSAYLSCYENPIEELSREYLRGRVKDARIFPEDL